MSRINVVVGADETELRVLVKNKINEEEISVIGYSDFGPDSQNRITGYVPDVFVCALKSDKLNEDFYNYLESLAMHSIGCSIIIVTDHVTVDTVNAAAQYGVRQVMDFDTSPDVFTANIKRIVSNEKKLATNLNVERKIRSKVYGFFSGKGGVGKTTLCTNLAVLLASMGKRTLLIDLDLQFGDADMALDLDPKDTIVELCRNLAGISIDNLSACCITHPSGLSVLASPSSPELSEYITSEHVKKILEVARPYYEYILLDCGCALTDPIITALEESDEIYMINDVNILSLKRAKLCLNVLQQINQQDKVRLVINKNMKKNNVKVSDFENLLGIGAFAIISNDIKTVNASLNNGQPFSTFKPRAPITKDIKAFVNRMIDEKED